VFAEHSATQNETSRPTWQQLSGPTLSVSSVASLLTYPPHIAPVPPPTGGPPSLGGPRVSLPSGVPPPAGVPLPAGVPPPGGVTSLAGCISVSAGLPLSIAAPVRLVGTGLAPTGVPPPAGVPPPRGVPPLAGFVSASGGLPLPVRVPVPLASPPTNVPPLTGGIPSSGSVLLPTSVPVPVGGPQRDGIPRPLGIPMAVGVPAPAVNSTLPPPRFFDPSVPPPSFIPSVSSAVVASVTEPPAMPVPRATEDMDLDNSTSSDEDLGEGFDEEWPICSRRTSTRSRANSQQLTVSRDLGFQLNESQASGSGRHSSELHSMPEKQLVRSDEYFTRSVEQPPMNQMYGTSLPVSGNNFAISSAVLDHNNPLPSAIASMTPLGGPALVRGQLSLLKPGSMPAEMVRAPGSVNPASDSMLRGPSDVDFRTSSYGAGIVPVGPPPLSTPMKMAPPPLPPLAMPQMSSPHFPGAVRPFTESSLPVLNDGSAGIGASRFNSPVAGIETPRDMLAPRLGGVAYPGSVGMSSNPPPGGLLGIRNIPGPLPLTSSTASVPGVAPGMVRGSYDNGPRFMNPVPPTSTFEPANVRPPPGQQVFMQSGVDANPGMMSAAPDIGPVMGRIPRGGQVLGGRPVGPGNISLPGSFVADRTLPVNPGNAASLRCPSEFGGVIRSVVPPDSVGLNVQHEMPRIRAPVPSSLPPVVNNSDQLSVAAMPQVLPLPRGPETGQLSSQLPRLPIEQKALSSGPSERLLSALHSLAGMQTEPSRDQPPYSSRGSRTGVTNPRFADSPIEEVTAGMQQSAPGLKKSLFGPHVDVSGFGSPVQSLLAQQNRTDGVGHGPLFGSLPAPPRLNSAQPRFALSGKFYAINFFVHFHSAFIMIVFPVTV